MAKAWEWRWGGGDVEVIKAAVEQRPPGSTRRVFSHQGATEHCWALPSRQRAWAAQQLA